MLYINDEIEINTDVIAIGTKEEIELYNQLLVSLDIMKDENFEIISCGIGGGIDFNIATPYPYGLPEKIGALFFNISTDFDVKCEELLELADGKERKFQILIQKK